MILLNLPYNTSNGFVSAVTIKTLVSARDATTTSRSLAFGYKKKLTLTLGH